MAGLQDVALRLNESDSCCNYIYHSYIAWFYLDPLYLLALAAFCSEDPDVSKPGWLSWMTNGTESALAIWKAFKMTCR